MKLRAVFFLALVLTSCATPAPTVLPTAAPPQPTQTPFIVLETVVVTVIPTNAPVEAPSATPLPPPTEVPATATSELAAQPAVEAADGLVPVDDAFGAGWFTGITRTRNDLSLRCSENPEITFSVKPEDPAITQIDFFYRIVDRSTGAVFDWQNAGRMIPDVNGSFTLAFSGDDVNANFRKPNAWLDYQFIGSNGSGVVGRSEKIEQQVSYTFDCP